MHKQASIAIAAAAVIAAAVGGTAYAVDQVQSQDKASGVEDNFLKLSNDGLDAMRAVRKARLDIFQGQTDQALADIATAEQNAGAAAKQSLSLDSMKGLSKDVKSGEAPSGAFLPLYAAVSVDEKIDLSPEHVDRLTKANMALRSGNTKAAAQALTAVPGDIQYNFASVPLEKLTSGVKDAHDQLAGGKFQVANMTLKGIEDSVRYDSFKLSGLTGKVAENTSYATSDEAGRVVKQ